MTLGFQEQNFDFHYEIVVIKQLTEEQILGITIDNKVKFKSRIIS